MLFAKRFYSGLRDGSIDLAFRYWKRPQVLPGRLHRSPVGYLRVGAVEVVAATAITDAQARRAGHTDAAEVVAMAAGRDGEGRQFYRIELQLAADAVDERAQLAADDHLSAADVAMLSARLQRLDRRAADGPWTLATLELIAAHPAIRAGDLAAIVGRERASFKTDVRKLKALGLTISLQRGYRLSPRGAALLGALGAAGGTTP